MLSISVEKLVERIVKTELVGKGRQYQALYFRFDLRLTYKEINAARGLHLLYHSKPGMQTISVFSGVTATGFGRIQDVDSWKHEISHDSEWTNLRVFSETYFDMSRQINAAIPMRPAYLSAAVAPNDMQQWHGFECYKWVSVEVIKERDDAIYRRKIRLLPD